MKEEEREKETVEREVLRVNLRKDSIEPVKDEVVVEDRIELYVNDEHYAVFSSSTQEVFLATPGFSGVTNTFLFSRPLAIKISSLY